MTYYNKVLILFIEEPKSVILILKSKNYETSANFPYFNDIDSKKNKNKKKSTYAPMHLRTPHFND